MAYVGKPIGSIGFPPEAGSALFQIPGAAVCQSLRLGGHAMSLPTPAPNHALHLTAYSVRSYLAPAFGSR